MSKRGAIALMLFIAAVMCFALAACGHQESSETNSDSDKIYIRITNDGTSAAGFGLTYYLGDIAVGSIGMKEASGENVSDEVVEFVLTREDVPKDADLEKFGLKFMVTEETGAELSVCTKYFPVKFGNTYDFKLMNVDGCYAVWSEFDGETQSGPQMNSSAEDAADQGTELQSFDLVSMDFMIVGKDEIKMNYADMEIYWAYGDQEDIPANDE